MVMPERAFARPPNYGTMVASPARLRRGGHEIGALGCESITQRGFRFVASLLENFTPFGLVGIDVEQQFYETYADVPAFLSRGRQF